MNSNELFEKSKKYVPGGVHSPVRSFKGLHTTPRFINRADGAMIWDEDGKNYVDFCMSFGPLIHGHKDPDVKKAIEGALERGWSYGACEKYSLELAEYMVERLGFVDQVRFMNSGTEAVMTAVRLARGITNREKIIKFNGCYHGHLDGMLIKAGSGLAGTADASSKGVTAKQAADTLIVELGDLEAIEECFKAHPNQIAAIFIEPLPANNGLLVQTTEYLQGLRNLCDKYGALLVFDEVISGFRVHFGGMALLTGVIPDLVTYGKIIGGGMPVGAVAGKRAHMEFLAPVGPVYQAGTLSGNPVAMAAGLANMKKLTPEAYQRLDQQSAAVVALLNEWSEGHGFADYSVQRFGSLFWAAPTKQKLNNITQIPETLMPRFYELFKVLLDKGIYLAPNAWEVGFISLAHDEKILAEMRKRLWS
ncbi:MAG: glutamate-1-semialdehyde 2,1-aminomutase [Bacteriovoracia bacterium]